MKQRHGRSKETEEKKLERTEMVMLKRAEDFFYLILFCLELRPILNKMGMSLR